MKTILLRSAIITACAFGSLSAQEAVTATSQAGAPQVPPSLKSEALFSWMDGKWEGWSETPDGKSTDKQEFDFDLDGQFIGIQFKGKFESGAMAGQTYKGKGILTKDPQTGAVVGFWFDVFRRIYRAEGKIEGNKMTTTWEGPTGKQVRVLEKIGEDKMVEVFKETAPDGSVKEGRSEYTRKKKDS